MPACSIFSWTIFRESSWLETHTVFWSGSLNSMSWLAVASSLYSLLIIDMLNIQTTLSMCWLSRSPRDRVIGSPRTPSTISPIGPPWEAPRSVVRDEILQFQPLVLTLWPSACLKGDWSPRNPPAQDPFPTFLMKHTCCFHMSCQVSTWLCLVHT